MGDEQLNEDPFDPPQLKPAERLPVRPPVSRPPSQDWNLVLVVQALFNEQARDKLFGTGPMEKIYSVPRRFDLATLFVVSTAFGFFCALLAYIEFSGLAKLSFCAGISIIGTSQAVLFGGRAPRLSSSISGGVVLVSLAIMFASTNRDFGSETIFFAIIFGPFAGYLVGTLVGGVFLISDNLRQSWTDSIRI